MHILPVRETITQGRWEFMLTTNLVHHCQIIVNNLLIRPFLNVSGKVATVFEGIFPPQTTTNVGVHEHGGGTGFHHNHGGSNGAGNASGLAFGIGAGGFFISSICSSSIDLNARHHGLGTNYPRVLPSAL